MNASPGTVRLLSTLLTANLRAVTCVCLCFYAGILLSGSPVVLAENLPWRAGIATADITPEEPIVLLGYSDRQGPFQSVDQPIFAKALALEDRQGTRGVIVTTDLVGVQDVVTGSICRRLAERTGLKRNQILLNASHNHTGPLLSLNPVQHANIAYSEMSPEDASRTVAYTHRFQDRVVELVETALENLEPANLSWGEGKVGFVMNRRTLTDKGVAMIPNPQGPTDPVVPVLKVESKEGDLLAVVFGCACHNTTLTGAHNLISGDYAGYAQRLLEDRYPGATALFMSGCGGDANPEPRGKLSQAREHGRELAEEVSRVLGADLKSVGGPLAMGYTLAELPLRQMSAEKIAEFADRSDSQSLMAKQMQSVVSEGRNLATSYPAPIAVWKFGTDLTLAALPAEPVARYAAGVRETLAGSSVWVAGYNNDCFGYLPSARIVREGGHEAIGITLWIWGEDLSDKVGFFAEETEEVVLETVREVLESLGGD